jgi:hypothetical protein
VNIKDTWPQTDRAWNRKAENAKQEPRRPGNRGNARSGYKQEVVKATCTLQAELDLGARSRSNSFRDKVRAHRKRLREQGLRPIKIWVPDMRSPIFVAEAHRQSLAVARSPHAKKDQDFIDAISDWGGT